MLTRARFNSEAGDWSDAELRLSPSGVERDDRGFMGSLL
jgi:hypothetical protein